ncbi:MAG: o-succinylbenzoate synthase [Nostocales cyanobacterium]|nr:MAG: o-succinylbenzoate synthase [Nostocales cyanobacterium]TAF17104.1 MAG: o-succinylbenzoate synthase [Nostocales cyanobacterium]
MIFLFDFRLFSQEFIRPVVTNYGVWKLRECIIIRLVDSDGNVAFGEVSPLPWFGSETMEDALSFCVQLQGKISQDGIFQIPDFLPACQFAFESALASLQKNQQLINYENLDFCGLLPSGKDAINQCLILENQGYTTFKWKIGVEDTDTEIEIFKLLISQLPSSAKLRLDANGGLNFDSTKLWLSICDQFSEQVEFLEQPLSADKFGEMLELSNVYQTKIALDESIATLQQLKQCYQQGWHGIFVIKPAIVGSPSRLKQFCQQHPIDLVFSSVFETEIGRKAALNLALELSNYHRALGFGVQHYFRETELNWLENLWNKN